MRVVTVVDGRRCLDVQWSDALSMVSLERPWPLRSPLSNPFHNPLGNPPGIFPTATRACTCRPGPSGS